MTNQQKPQQQQDTATDAQQPPAKPPAPMVAAAAGGGGGDDWETKLARIPGTFRNPEQINTRLRWAENNCFLISPATSVGKLPEGCAVAFSIVTVDPRDMVKDGGETYDNGSGRRALAKSALDRIAAAAGISWDPHLCARIDDRSDQHFCAYRAVGHVRHFDGTEQTLVRTKEMDVRNGSTQIDGMAPKQVKGQRIHLVAHCESKAMNRVVRALGLKSAFTQEELHERPFVVAKLMWTGQSDDPALRARFAELTAARMLGGSQALFGLMQGPATGGPGALPPGSPGAPPLIKPPPVGAVGQDPDEVSDAQLTSPRPRPQQPMIDVQATSREVPPSDPGNAGPLVKFGENRGKPIASLSDQDLGWYIRTLRESIADATKAKYRASNEAALADAMADQNRRVDASEPAADDAPKTPRNAPPAKPEGKW